MSKKSKPLWEPGYNGQSIGGEENRQVTRHAGKDAKQVHRGRRRAGGGDDLDKAKRAVEAAVAMADKQLDLFGQ
jgi:hypothetical protein